MVLRMEHYKYRKNAELGVWCSLLLPFCLLSLCFSDKTGKIGLYSLLSTMCIWLVIVDFLKRNVYQQIYEPMKSLPFYLITSLPISIFIWKLLPYYNCFFHVLTICFLTTWCYCDLTHILLKQCPGSFTLGEAQVLSQMISLFLLCTEFSFSRQMCSSFLFSDYKGVSGHVRCLQVLILGSLFLIYLTYKYTYLQEMKNFFGLFLLTSILMLCAWYLCLGDNIFSWLIMFCLSSKKKIYLMLFWIVCTAVSILFVIFINLSSIPSGSTVIRKVFHFIITLVFVPGILYDLELLRLSSGIVFCAFLILELFRILKVPLVGMPIENAFKIFLDEKDTGLLILTHIYLLIGCSFPIWMYGYSLEVNGSHLSLYSGILSVGIGDTTAAIGGKLFGRYKWKSSNKTYEGSLCCLLMQMIFAFLFLNLTDHTISMTNNALIMIAVVLTTYLEAKTNQVDNLVLPLFMFSILSWIN